SMLLAFFGGRWRIAASIFFALVASASFCSLINIIFLPHSLLPRLIVYAILTPLLIVGTLVPHKIVRHTTLRTCTALTGSGGIVISIALFTKVPSWSSPWLTLAIAPYVGDRNAHEKGLSAGLCVLAVAGAAVDWLFKLKLGENPDKEWDAYLAKYSRSLPFSSERTGSFQPYESFWTRLFNGRLFRGRSDSDRDILFPPESQLLPKSAKSHPGAEEVQTTFTGSAPPSFKPYPFTASRKPTLLSKKSKTRSPLKGGVLSDSSDSDSSGDENRNARQESVASSPPTPAANVEGPTISMPQPSGIDGLASSGNGSESPAVMIDDGFWEHLRAKAGEFKPLGHPHTPRR
ncbi:hypothetical protein FRB90_011817, partial [Tulasnella sp. 427]